MIFDVLARIEADPPQQDLARGWRAELADPEWLLGRQWQMGGAPGGGRMVADRRGGGRSYDCDRRCGPPAASLPQDRSR
jgi:hypothetical protein